MRVVCQGMETVSVPIQDYYVKCIRMSDDETRGGGGLIGWMNGRAAVVGGKRPRVDVGMSVVAKQAW